MRKLALTLIFFLIANHAFAEFGRSTSFDDREICDRDKGVWREFGNSAGDNCESKMDRFAISAQALTYACDCGKGRCWDAGRCVLMTDYKKTYDERQEKEQKKMAEARKNRQDEYRDNSNDRLRKLIDGASRGGSQDASGKGGSGNNLAQFSDKIPASDVAPQQQQQYFPDTTIPNLNQQAQTIVDEGAKQVENGPIGSFFSVPTTPAPTVQSTANSGVATNPATDGPTPFFLQQQEKAKQEADAAAAAKAGITIFDPTKPQAPDTNSLSDIPGLPQIPLPQ